MNLKKIASVIVIYITVGTVFSCEYGGDVARYNVYHASIFVQNYDTSSGSPKYSDNKTIDKNNYRMCIGIRWSYNPISLGPGNSFSIFPSAYADLLEIYQLMETIEQIRIITLYDFNSTHPEGSDVAHMFMSRNYDGLKNIREAIEKHNSNEHHNNSPNIWLELVTPPTLGEVHNFRVEIVISDKRVLTAETGDIKLI